MPFRQVLCSLALDVVLLTGLFVATPAAWAVPTFHFSFAGEGGSGSGDVSAVANGDGTFTAIAGAGTVTVGSLTEAITSLVSNPNGTLEASTPMFLFDNQLFPTAAPTLSIDGLLFVTASGLGLNLYALDPFSGPGGYQFLESDNTIGNISFSLLQTGFDPVAVTVPEPSAIFLLSIGLLIAIFGVGAARRRAVRPRTGRFARTN